MLYVILDDHPPVPLSPLLSRVAYQSSPSVIKYFRMLHATRSARTLRVAVRNLRRSQELAV
jgi:hypothetical protein